VSVGYRFSAAFIVSLLILQMLWHALIFPPAVVPRWLVAGLFVLPILPAVLMLARRGRHAPFWGAVAALFYFSHGLMETWATPQVRTLALVEVALSVALIVAASWGGLKARFDKRKHSPTV